MSAMVYVSSMSKAPARVERMGDLASIRFGSAVISIDMPDLRDLCNDIAKVLDGWYDEQDRNGRVLRYTESGTPFIGDKS